MATKQDHENEISSVDLTEVANQPPADEAAEEKSFLPPTTKAWLLLIVHGGVSIALALSIALAVNGYEAIDSSNPRPSDGKLILRVSDVTTLVSVALVIVKLIVSSWSTLALWGCGHYLLYRAQPREISEDISFMMRWKLPPWMKRPLTILKAPRNIVISIGVLFILVQAFIGPILTGAVNWNTSSVASKQIIKVSSTNPAANFGGWYWYSYPVASQRISSMKPNLREAAGLASLAWADSTAISPNGTSLTGNGCRHVVNDDNLPANSTVANMLLPCIDFHGITWYDNSNDVSVYQFNLVADAGPISLVADSPSTYYVPGVSTIFDPNLLYNTSQNSAVPPAPLLYKTTTSNIKTVSLMVNRQTPATNPPCVGLTDTAFGDISKFNYYLLDWGDATNKNCFLVGLINFTAGVTTSPRSTYISSRIVEDQTPMNEVIFEPNSWVQEAIWLLPDLMTMIATMNSSQMPTFNNIENYVELLTRQAYLAAWDMLHNSFDQNGAVIDATPEEPRLKAEVSFARVFAWLAVSLLMTISGALLLVVVPLRGEDLKPPRDLVEENRKDRMDELKGTGKDMLQDLVGSGS